MSDISATILVVDDDNFTAELTGMILEMAGFDILVAENGLDALEQMADHPAIRIVVSDMNMPFIDGVELFAELRTHGFSQPFILLTGEDAAPLRLAHPDMAAVISKNEELPETLPKIVHSLLTGS